MLAPRGSPSVAWPRAVKERILQAGSRPLARKIIAVLVIATVFLVLKGPSDTELMHLHRALGLDLPDSITRKDFRVHFVSFADCGSFFRLGKIKRQAELSGFFDTINVFSLKSLDPDFLERNQDFVPSPDTVLSDVRPDGKPLIRGCGYWLWKPQALLQAMRIADDGDVMVYADAGCTIVNSNWKHFWRMIDVVRGAPRLKAIGFVLMNWKTNKPLTERAWTKGDLFRHFNVTDYEAPPASSGQLHSTYFYMVKNSETIALVEEWIRIGEAEGHHLIDDSPSKAPNAEDFEEHRHDQSIFSLLRKTRGAVTFVTDEWDARAPIQAYRCRYKGDSCWRIPFKGTFYAWETLHKPNRREGFDGNVLAAMPQRGSSRLRAAVLPMLEDA